MFGNLITLENTFFPIEILVDETMNRLHNGGRINTRYNNHHFELIAGLLANRNVNDSPFSVHDPLLYTPRQAVAHPRFNTNHDLSRIRAALL